MARFGRDRGERRPHTLEHRHVLLYADLRASVALTDVAAGAIEAAIARRHAGSGVLAVVRSSAHKADQKNPLVGSGVPFTS